MATASKHRNRHGAKKSSTPCSLKGSNSTQHAQPHRISKISNMLLHCDPCIWLASQWKPAQRRVLKMLRNHQSQKRQGRVVEQDLLFNHYRQRLAIQKLRPMHHHLGQHLMAQWEWVEVWWSQQSPSLELRQKHGSFKGVEAVCHVHRESWQHRFWRLLQAVLSLSNGCTSWRKKLRKIWRKRNHTYSIIVTTTPALYNIYIYYICM